MKSNGYGSFIQSIIIRITQPHSNALAKALRTEPFSVTPKHHDFEWNRKTARAGRDDDIVFEFGMLYPDIPDDSYQFLWSESEY